MVSEYRLETFGHIRVKCLYLIPDEDSHICSFKFQAKSNMITELSFVPKPFWGEHFCDPTCFWDNSNHKNIVIGLGDFL